MLSANAFNLDWSMILLFGEELFLLPSNKILLLSKLKAVAYDKFLAKMTKFVFYTVETWW